MRTKPKQILLVEDDPSQRRLLKKIFLGRWDCEVREAEDGLAALNIILKEKLRPDLIMLDLIMPHIDGMGFLRIIKSKPEISELPIVICSSVDNAQTVLDIAKYGVKDFLTKPVDRVALAQKVLPYLQL